MINLFRILSQVLTGEPSLAPQRAADFYGRIDAHYGKELGDLLQAFASECENGAVSEESAWKALGDNPGRHAVARAIIMLWYTGEFERPDGKTDPVPITTHFSESLLWKVILTHPPAFTDTGYGAWAGPPTTSTPDAISGSH